MEHTKYSFFAQREEHSVKLLPTGPDHINSKFPLGDLNRPKKRAITISLITWTAYFQREIREMKITTTGSRLRTQ